MPEYRTIRPWRDRETGERHAPPSTATLSAERGERLVRKGCVEPVAPRTETARVEVREETATRDDEPYPKHVGGGWYELPGGERVQGRGEAERRMGA